MKRFAQLYMALDQTNRTSEKVAAMRDYFREAPPRDAIWAVYLLSGRKLGRTISSRLLRTWVAEVTGYPGWLVEECVLLAGDLSETLSLILPDQPVTDPPALHDLIENQLRKIGRMDQSQQRAMVVELWQTLSVQERFVLHKLLSGNFRVGVSRLLMIRALAEAAGVEPAIMAHRLSGNWSPDEATMLAFLAPPGADAAARDPALPYPFMLAHALQEPPESLGDLSAWYLEWKWDGIRAQLIRREHAAGSAARTVLWSRGEELITDAFPELIRAAEALPAGTVLDGEILGWDEVHDRPLTFAQLQPRINRKNVELSLWPDIPVRYMAFDLLEYAGEDLRELPLERRRGMLESCIQALHAEREIRLSPPATPASWEELPVLIAQSRELGVEGLMLKRRDSGYKAGRPTGLWWKLKVQPYAVDAVLVAAQPGHGRRAGLLTDYTFAVWHENELVTITKAYSGLTDEELTEMDRWIRKNAKQRYGPVYTVDPVLVFEIGFEAMQRSTRHKSGIAFRFPRILRIRHDKKPADADTLETVRAMLTASELPRKAQSSAKKS